MASNPENVRSNVLMKLQEALDEEAILEEQILTLMHRFADRFTDRRVEINNLMVLQDHPLIDYAISRHWPVHQLDVKNAFLHGDLAETVYMHQPPGFRDPEHPDYGDDTTFLLLYVDDIVLTASSDRLLQQIIASLHREFSMTDLGALNYFLGISVTRDSSGMFLSQRDGGTPVVDPTLYRSLAGSLQYLTFTRPDITYAVQQVCLYMHDPREPHFSALKRILRVPALEIDYAFCSEIWIATRQHLDNNKTNNFRQQSTIGERAANKNKSDIELSEDIELAKKDDKLKNEEIVTKLKEQRCLEEKVKAEALERKKQIAEKARIRA
ncbi:ribonuclease H-like domain-containing protein [Tanacetum coccineum]